MEGDGSNGDSEKGVPSNIIGELSRAAIMSSVPEFVQFVSSVERQESFSDERIAEVEAAVREALTAIIPRLPRAKAATSPSPASMTTGESS